MGQLQTWTWDQICDLQEELEEQRPVPVQLAVPHAVYRLYGPSDLVLYIGCTRNPRRRLATHKCLYKTTWWPHVVRHEITWYPDRSQAILVETHELRKHRPLCNPVIPDRTGKHSTVTAGRKPVQSLWAQVDEIARQNGMTVMDVIYGELDRYVRRHRGHAPTEGGTT